jgi:endonuclease YncB( thermonuclease family)
MPGSLRSKGAPRPGALFFIFSCLLTAALQATAVNCPAPGNGEQVEVAHVYDGDTVRLADGRRLRLIGINAPETGHSGQPPQPLAAQARSVLESLLERQNNALTLQYGTTRQDHYGRLLAHAFLQDGDNLAVPLLEQGLATALAVPPNTRAADCYRHIEARARTARLGVWSLPEYQSVAAANLSPDTRGFRLVAGRVLDIRQTRYSIWLQLDGPLAAHIARRDLVYFPADYPQALLGRRVEVRGWLKPDTGGLKLNIRHPAALLRPGAKTP